MRIAYLTHFYPPSSSGGAGKYTAATATMFRQRGADVAILCADQWGVGKQHINGFTDDEFAGVSVRRVHINWRKAPRPFDYLYDNPDIDLIIQEFLQEFQPEIVHITSCYSLSARLIELAKRWGAPTVVHLVDFWFICPLHTLLRRNGELCFGGKDAWDCQQCVLTGTKYDLITRRILSEPLRAALTRLLAKQQLLTRSPGMIGLLGDMERRRSLVLHYLNQADVLIAPSFALRDLYARNGIATSRVQVMHYGHDVAWADQVQRTPGQGLRVAYIGNILPIKGVHVLIDAFRQLHSELDIKLDIHGHDDLDQDYTARLRATLPSGCRWHGIYHPAELPAILGGIDVVVVPSLWHENNPLVIQEAFAAGCPVIVSNLAGMTEMIQDGVNGLHFEPGNHADLARKIRMLATICGLLDALRQNIPSVRTMEQEYDDLLAIYQRLLNNR